ncbi:MAG: TetR/AcrR family transcriptional regulator [Actinomycetota bacterium]|nr:TetR/AcrR family transcriptional regulator [Actinomycetota bacterium]
MAAPARRRRAPKGEGDRLRAEILAATEQLLIETGDEAAVSVRAIADAAGVTPPSIYLHFADKDELVFAVCQQQFAELGRRMEEAARGVEDPVQALTNRGRAYITFGAEHPAQYRILFMGKREMTREDFESGTLPGMEAFTQVVGSVQACMDAGAFAPGDAFVVATGLWAVVHGVTSLRITVPGFPLVDADALVEHVLEVQARGLTAESRPIE